MDTPMSPDGVISMDDILGLLRVKVIKGVNLAVRDVLTSDPYAVVKMGCQRLRTRTINKDVNPVWNENLTLSVTDPNLPVQLAVLDHDTFSKDDPMGDAEFDVKPLMEAVKKSSEDAPPSGTVMNTVQPCSDNCLSEESQVVWNDGTMVQHMMLRLKNVECGEVELSLSWIDLPGC